MIKQINVGVIGTGWCGGIRANACNNNPLVNKLYIAETNKKRLVELKGSLDIEGATENWQELVSNDEIDTIIISATPETIKEVLNDLIQNPQKRIDLGKRGREFALKWHSAKSGGKKMDEIYSSILDYNK